MTISKEDSESTGVSFETQTASAPQDEERAVADVDGRNTCSQDAGGQDLCSRFVLDSGFNLGYKVA